MTEIPIGIDLGTTNTVAAYHYDRKIGIIEPKEGNGITPSFVLYNDEEQAVVGNVAKRMASRRSTLTIYEMKRLIGRKFDDPVVTNSLKYFPFDLEADNNNDPVIVLDNTTVSLKTTPLRESARILEKIAKDIKRKFGQTLTKSVITVPTNFNNHQRQATLKAAQIAGFQVLKLLNESSAAALDYLHDNPSESGDYFMVFDLGGGCFDVTIFQKKLDHVEVVSVNGDSALGGHDIDNLIIDYVCHTLKTEYNYSPIESQMARIKMLCKEAKEDLSVIKSTEILLDGFVPGYGNSMLTLNRKELEKMTEKMFKKIIKIVNNTLKCIKLSKNDIKTVVLVGGSTRIPKISKILKDYFGRDIVSKVVDPDECVARGAALQAAMIMRPEGDYKNFKIRDVTPLSIGTSILMNNMNFIIKRNTPIPHTTQVTYQNLSQNQDSISFELFEGERTNCKYNRSLGKMTGNSCHLKLKLMIDQNGLVHVCSKGVLNNRYRALTIDYSGTKIRDINVKNSVQDAEDFAEEDRKFDTFAKKALYLIQYCNFIKYNMDELGLTARYRGICDSCDETLISVELLEVNDIELVETALEEIENRTEDLVHEYGFKFKPLKNFGMEKQ